MSASAMPWGRHNSRMLQLEQVTSNFFGAAADLMAVTAYMALLLLASGGDALRDDVAQAVEFPGFVEKSSRAQPFGDLPVRIGGVVREQVDVDFRRPVMQRAQHFEAAAVRELDVQHHEVGTLHEDGVDRCLDAERVPCQGGTRL